MSRFIIALNNGNREQRNVITALLQAKGWGLWHHLEDVWLICGVPDGVSARAISEEISSISLIGQHPKLVIELPPGRATHWGHANQEGWNWMQQFWGDPG
jgi:hypothetical protein